jgi:hypothetical protein
MVGLGRVEFPTNGLGNVIYQQIGVGTLSGGTLFIRFYKALGRVHTSIISFLRWVWLFYYPRWAVTLVLLDKINRLFRFFALLASIRTDTGRVELFERLLILWTDDVTTIISSIIACVIAYQKLEIPGLCLEQQTGPHTMKTSDEFFTDYFRVFHQVETRLFLRGKRSNPVRLIAPTRTNQESRYQPSCLGVVHFGD